MLDELIEKIKSIKFWYKNLSEKEMETVFEKTKFYPIENTKENLSNRRFYFIIPFARKPQCLGAVG